jgi:hypothetical protein
LDPVLCEYLDLVVQRVMQGPALPQEQLVGEVRRSVSRLRDRRDRRELLELESLLRDAQETGSDELELRGQVEGLRRRIRERQRQWPAGRETLGS